MLEIKTGELLAKTEELKEVSENLRGLNEEIRVKTKKIKDTGKSSSDVEIHLVTVIEELTETNERLETRNKEIIEVSKELVDANEKIRQLILKQKDFLDISAHEIKTPVQAILGYSEMLMADPQTNTKYTNLIMHNALRIQKLLSNILDMAKIDNDSLMLDKERFNLEALVYNVIEDSKNQIAHLKKKSKYIV